MVYINRLRLLLNYSKLNLDTILNKPKNVLCSEYHVMLSVSFVDHEMLLHQSIQILVDLLTTFILFFFWGGLGIVLVLLIKGHFHTKRNARQKNKWINISISLIFKTNIDIQLTYET